ncbi:hypothetical protein GCM10011506_01930 [Marivirga lumbricoides]|uniref:DUF2071 domain-containing protein n=1 Tax=Marivirga lumbricoides TaxID=1046115 RepID=A0ABQ1LCX3_9BACT|nr:hypothetical protein GCM10011506_01930 [Marivirga lumbricoides]
MTIKEILVDTEHRPWTIPAEKWQYYQEWNKAVFLHWQVDIEGLQELVPAELEIDLYEGKPWVSLVAFTMEKIRPRNLPSFPPISDFDEINIRTYVKKNNKTGVYFLSIEGGTYLSCQIAKKLSELPYRYSNMHRKKSFYSSENKLFKDRLHINYQVAKAVTEKTALDKWLTERYVLFQDTKTSINEFEIHHLEWPIYELDTMELEVDYPRFKKILSNFPDKKHYSTGVKVIAWGKRKSEKGILK